MKLIRISAAVILILTAVQITLSPDAAVSYITEQPQSAYITGKGSCVLSLKADTGCTFRWYCGGTLIEDKTYGNIRYEGTDSTALSIIRLSGDYPINRVKYDYICIVSKGNDEEESKRVFTVFYSESAADTIMRVVNESKNVSVRAGQGVTLRYSAESADGLPVSYVWNRCKADGVITGDTSGRAEVFSPDTSKAGIYYYIATAYINGSGAGGSIRSSVMKVSVSGTSSVSDAPSTPHIHSYSIVRTEPDCTTAGYTKSVCICGREKEYKELPALGHCYGEWTTVTAADQQTEGLQERYCTRVNKDGTFCQANQTKIIPKLSASEQQTESGDEGLTDKADSGQSVTDIQPETDGNSDSESLIIRNKKGDVVATVVRITVISAIVCGLTAIIIIFYKRPRF